ncbi:hypothetical protein Hanom_Chr17g01529111 [Helianthus anomalus]
MAASAATPSTGVTVSASGATPAAAKVTSPTHVSKNVAYALPLGMYLWPRMLLSATWFISLNILFNPGITGGVQGQDVTPTSLTSASIAAVSCVMPPSLPTAAVTVTTSPISTPLSSNIVPSSLFDSPLSVFSATEKEMPTVSATHEATSAEVAAVSNAGGSSSGIADDGGRLGDDGGRLGDDLF